MAAVSAANIKPTPPSHTPVRTAKVEGSRFMSYRSEGLQWSILTPASISSYDIHPLPLLNPFLEIPTLRHLQNLVHMWDSNDL